MAKKRAALSKTKAGKGAPKGPKAAGKRKTKDNVPGAAGVEVAGPGPGHNSKPRRMDPDKERELFLQHRRKIEAARAKEEAAKAIRLEAEADAKVEGFPKKLFAIARDLAGSAKKEAKVEGEVADRLKVARWIGHKLGAQMDLFNEPDRTPSVDRAFDAGKQASMENQPCKPPHAPDSEQYRSWMAGYQQHQATLSGGFKKLEPDGEAITSGERVTRKEFHERLKARTAGAPDPNAPVPGEAAADLLTKH